MNDLPNAYELRLIREIEEIEGKIRDLEQERSALQRQLMKARLENIALRDVSRKNSANRVIVEQRILQVLGDAKKPMASAKLLNIARLANFELRDNTFRTHLHRMKAKGMIKSVKRGLWTLPKD